MRAKLAGVPKKEKTDTQKRVIIITFMKKNFINSEDHLLQGRILKTKIPPPRILAPFSPTQIYSSRANWRGTRVLGH